MSDHEKREVKHPGREAMRRPLPKRFYKEATVGPTKTDQTLYRLLLDGRAAKTPLKRALAVPSPDLAEAIAAEWRAQQDAIDPAIMPLTTLACTTIDAVADKRREVADEIVKYASSDLLCYRAETPRELVERQRMTWDPFIDWARVELSAPFVLTTGMMPVAQPHEAAAAVARILAPLDPYSLAATHVLTTLTGSAVLAVAVLTGHTSFSTAWNAAHVDEDWQIEQWGGDDDAAARRKKRHRDAAAAAQVLNFMRNR